MSINIANCLVVVLGLALGLGLDLHWKKD